MSNKDQITRFIKEKIREKVSKTQIETELASKYEEKEYRKILRDFPEPALKEKYKITNGVLVACIIIITLFKLLSILEIGFSLGVIPILLLCLIGLVIPTILVVYLFSCRASIYIVTTFLLLSGFVRSFRGTEELFASADVISISIFALKKFIGLLAICLSIFLWKKIYPNYKFFSK